MEYQDLAQREVIGYWRAILATLRQRGLLRERPQLGGYVIPQALGVLDQERVYFILDMLRLAGIARERWLDRDLWQQWRAALSGRRVVVADGYGLVICVARQPGMPVARRLPDVVELTEERIPADDYTVCLGITKRGDVRLDVAGRHRAILTGGTSGSGKTTMMKSLILQLAQKHTPGEFSVAIVDTKEVDFGAVFDRLPHLFAPIAHTMEEAGRLIEAVEGERRGRQATMARAGVPDWRMLDETSEGFRLLLLVVDEAADFAKTAVMETLIEIARKGRAMGVSIVLGTQLPSARVIDPQVRANLPTAIAFQCRTHLESQAILGTGGAEALDRPGLALAFLDGRWQTIQTLHVGMGDLAGATPPAKPALSELEVALVRYAVEGMNGAFIIGRLYEEFAGQISKRALTRLGQRWEMRGWLTEPAHATDARRVTKELLEMVAPLSLPPDRRGEDGDRVIGVTGGDRSLGTMIGPDDREVLK